ncbi:MAG: polyprenyl synthetase family protein [Chitinophagales bacterium]|nr:polyprenyl synthetase family protein [Chitinophagales bacterium]MDW8418101.1 polyprenyl synthetase family protein [Chitinophagales bacterium]
MHTPEQLLQLYDTTFSKNNFNTSPTNLYKPVEHIMSMKGKRLRPLLVMLSCEMFGGDVTKSLNAAFAMEVFHNFTLVHDDIMDKAETRRGMPTVHKVFGLNAAILAGDVMLAYAYKYLTASEPAKVPALMELFNTTAIQIFEGQQMDVDFEERDDVTEEEYLKMIEYKTSVLMACCTQTGAILAGADITAQKKIYDFGLYLGLSFQVRDDLLDAFGDGKKVGKKIGGDILLNKKTFLLLRTMRLCNDAQRAQLNELLREKDEHKKISGIQHLMQITGGYEQTKNEADRLFQQSISALESVGVPAASRSRLYDLACKINNRDY